MKKIIKLKLDTIPQKLRLNVENSKCVKFEFYEKKNMKKHNDEEEEEENQ